MHHRNNQIDQRQRIHNPHNLNSPQHTAIIMQSVPDLIHLELHQLRWLTIFGR